MLACVIHQPNGPVNGFPQVIILYELLEPVKLIRFDQASTFLEESADLR